MVKRQDWDGVAHNVCVCVSPRGLKTIHVHVYVHIGYITQATYTLHLQTLHCDGIIIVRQLSVDIECSGLLVSCIMLHVNTFS